MNLQKLQLENQDLKRKLQIAEAWMKREVRQQVARISEEQQNENDNVDDNSEEIISEKITEFIGEILLLNIPSSVMENIISAEIGYHHMQSSAWYDGLSVISSYHKALDTLIENFITKWFRKFAHKQKQTVLRENNVLEKSLHAVVSKWYILGIWRLFHILKVIKTDDSLGDYGKCFKKYLEKYRYLGDCLLSDEIYTILEVLVNSEILGKKRHVWKITFDETKEARTLLIGNFQNESCLLYRLIETQSLDF